MSAASLKANEPSMEEILASIRRIIADDAGKADAAPDEPADDKATAAAPVAPVSDDAEDEDVLDLALVAAEPLVKIDLEPLPQSVELDEDIEFRVVEEPLVAEVAPEPEPVAVAPPPPPPPAPESSAPDMLLSPQVDATVALAFQSLASTLVPQNARTLEDIVKDMMRPMLKSWLDEHLPGVVERLVKAEIERVSRGQRG